MRKKIILRQIIGVWAENDLKIGLSTNSRQSYQSSPKSKTTTSDHQRVPQASLTLAKVSVYDSTICSKKKTTASYLTLWLSTLLSVWRTWGVPTPTKHRIFERKHAWRWRLSVVGVLCCFYSTCHVEGNMWVVKRDNRPNPMNKCLRDETV